jgi:hypothetical protein
VTEHDAQHVGAPTFAVWFNNRGARAQVDLRLESRLALDPPERQHRRLAQTLDVTPHAVITGRLITMLLTQILPDPHGRQPGFQTHHDRLVMRPAIAHRMRRLIGGFRGFGGWGFRR